MADSKKQQDPNVVQRKASDPKASVWVTASAGTGKTKVLTDRVLRLMLSGVKPGEIMCLTFTKAGAAVMNNRIRDELANWATMNERDLDARLTKLTGKRPDDADMDQARSLFAQFLDAQEGMRVQTIHSFAQSLIRRFPIESGIPPYFDVMDEQTATALLQNVRADVLRSIEGDDKSQLARAVHMITPEVSEEDFTGLISEITYRRGELLSIFEKHGGIDPTIDAIYKYLGAKRGTDSKKLNEQLNSDEGLDGHAPDIDGLNLAADILAEGSAADLEKAKMIKAWILHPEQRTELFWDYASVFLTADGEMRKKLTTKASAGAQDFMEAEARRLMDGIEAISTMNVARGTESILRLTSEILRGYAEKKKAQNLLDYDDLIHHANKMMREDGSAAWVLQKLPGNLRHVLVDEAQDTNPDQWSLVSAIVREFFEGPAQKKDAGKTLFVVGDEKQSIFSFQRADPREFGSRKKFFEELVTKNGGQWRQVEMDIAFRSSPAITQVVDAVFKNPDASDGLFFRGEEEDKEVRHDPFRKGQAGIVELHPLVQSQKSEELKPWDVPLTMQEQADPQVELADKIATRIDEMLKNKEQLESRGRRVTPGDILILVRRRSEFVDHMVRALKKRDVPVAGADRMSLSEQIAVMDMVALGEFLLFPKDDYKLACVLKSPLVGMDDAALEKIAANRTGSLWEALEKEASGKKAKAIYRKAHDYLQQMASACVAQRPYEFYSSILMNACPANDKSGLQALYGRLGFEAEDPLVEFMNAIERFERANIPTLQGFLSWLSAGEAEVKREISLGKESPRVHIMTVHGAKGLEAPVVFLPDTTGIPDDNTRARPRFLWPDKDRAVPLWVPRADLENQTFRNERLQAEQERDREFRRLLYVAMTRAADRLYVYGAQGQRALPEKSWYALIKKGLEDNLMGVDVNFETGVMTYKTEQTAKPKPDGVKAVDKIKLVGIPAWARTNPTAAPVESVGRFKPSDFKATNDDYSAPSPLAEKSALYHSALGDAVHELLELLPVLPAEEREDAMRAYLAKPALGITKKDQEDTAKQLMDVLTHSEFGSLFGENSRAEVTITGYVMRGGEKQLLSGQIDRLVVDDKTVTIVDYKNSMYVPKRVEEVRKEYQVQMAAYRMILSEMYPDKEIKCALLWTREAKFMPLPSDMLDKAIADIGITPAPAVATLAKKQTGMK